MGCGPSSTQQMKYSDLEKENKTKCEEIQKLNNELTTYKRSLDTSSEQCKKIPGLEKNLGDLKKINESLKDENSNLGISLEEHKKELEILEQKYADILKDKERLENELSCLQQNYKKSKENIAVEKLPGIGIDSQIQIISLFNFHAEITKPEFNITSEYSFYPPSIEHKILLNTLQVFQVFSLKKELSIEHCYSLSIPHLKKPQLEIEYLDCIDIPNKIESADTETSTTISIPPNSSDLLYSIHSDSSVVFKLPVTEYLIPVTYDLKMKLPKQCIYEENHIFTYNPGFMFKYYSKYQSFKPTCSICSFSGFNQFWSCGNCSMLICFNCKPLTFLCPSGHSYTSTNTLNKKSCSSCLIEKVSVFIECETCAINLCEICALTQSKAKLECENSHRLSLGEGELVCSYCKVENSVIGCECSSLCQNCSEYLESGVFYHPGLGCENEHLLHAAEIREKCSVCETEKEFLYYCRDCLVFICNSCGDEYIKTLYSKPLCKNMHKLQLNYSIQQKSSVKPGLRNFACDQCDTSYTLKAIPFWGSKS